MSEENSATTAGQVAIKPSLSYLTKGEIAERLRCTRRTVEEWMQKGLPHYCFGSRKSLFKWEEVERFMERFRTARIGKCARAA